MSAEQSHLTSTRPDPAVKAPPSVEKFTDVIDRVIDVAQSETVSLRDVIRSVGDASFSPILLLPAVAVATPLSGIPLFSSTMGIVIFLVSIQMLLRRDHLWLPNWAMKRAVNGSVVHKAFSYLRPIGRWIDGRTRRRLRVLVHRPLVFVPQILCALSGALMPLFEFIPFSSSIVGAGVALLALGMMTRDGMVILIGLLPYGALAWLVSTAAA